MKTKTAQILTILNHGQHQTLGTHCILCYESGKGWIWRSVNNPIYGLSGHHKTVDKAIRSLVKIKPGLLGHGFEYKINKVVV